MGNNVVTRYITDPIFQVCGFFFIDVNLDKIALENCTGIGIIFTYKISTDII